MIKLSMPVIVEGKYDIIKLSNIIDGIVIKTDGFGIFRDREKQQLLRRLAKEKGIIVLTDSDSAGFMIRNFISSVVQKEKIVNVYIPDVYGKEKRKTVGGREGKIGVEGMSEAVLEEAFRKAGVFTGKSDNTERRLITNIDLYEWGFSGRPDSKAKKKELLKRLDLPERLSTSSLVKILNTFISYEEFIETAKEISLCE